MCESFARLLSGWPSNSKTFILCIQGLCRSWKNGYVSSMTFREVLPPCAKPVKGISPGTNGQNALIAPNDTYCYCYCCYYYYTTTTFNGLFSRTTWVSQHQKGKTSLDLNEARDDGVLGRSGISWTICKQSAPRSRQITTPTQRPTV